MENNVDQFKFRQISLQILLLTDIPVHLVFLCYGVSVKFVLDNFCLSFFDIISSCSYTKTDSCQKVNHNALNLPTADI